MTQRINTHGQPVGDDVPGWTGAPAIPHTPIAGTHCDVVPLSMDHAAALFTAYTADTSGALWTYMPVGPFDDAAGFANWLNSACNSSDPLFFAIIDKASRQPRGIASYLRIDPANGVAEVGFIAFAPALQRTVIATEAMFLMMRRIFDELGYRRYEWKCDALNAPSQAAAKRLGFSYDGLFRQAVVYKGRNRDTAWFSILDRDWPRIRQAFEAWLAPDNFDADGQQKASLRDLIGTISENCSDLACKGTNLCGHVFSSNTHTLGESIMKTKAEAFHHTLKDIYYAENAITKAMPKMIAAVKDADTKKAFEDHLTETKEQIKILKKVFGTIDEKAEGEKCDAIEGLIKETEGLIDEASGDALNAMLIGAAQAVEHYEIARYGTLRQWAKELKNDEAHDLLSQILDMEKAANAKLTGIAVT